MSRKKTYEEFRLEVYNKHKGEYVLVSREYVNWKTPVLIKHNVCGKIYSIRPDNYLQGRLCSDCKRKKKEKISEIELASFLENFTLRSKGNYTLCSNYKGKEEGIVIKHLVCSKKFSMTASNFILGKRGCPYCYDQTRIKKIKLDLYREKIKDLHKGEYTLLAKEVNSSIPLRIRHNVCGNEFSMRIDNFLKGRLCPSCRESKNLINSHSIVPADVFLSKFKERAKKDYILMSFYVKMSDKIKIKHVSCNRVFEMTPKHFIHSNLNCPLCSVEGKGKIKKTHEMFKHLLKEKGFTPIDEYKGSEIKLNVRHDVCNEIFNVRPSNILKSTYRCLCERDTNSLGEEKIFSYLKNKNISFKTQYSFEDCVYITKLRFDFAIFKESKLVFLIEFDGKQHYEEVEYFGGKESFVRQLKRDKVKRTYCKTKNIPLLRIPFTERNVELLIDKTLNKFNLQ